MSFNAVEYLTKLVHDSADDEYREMSFEETICWLQEQGLRYEFEERASILEYDGGLSRDAADRQALREIIKRLEYTVSGGNQND
jgi:hypothetical protein